MKYLKQIVIQTLSTSIKIAFAQFIYIIKIALSWYEISFSGNLFPCFEARDSCSDYIANNKMLQLPLFCIAKLLFNYKREFRQWERI